MTAETPLRRKTIALVGLMGVGKSSIGRRLATALGLPFRDADAEVETAAGRSIAAYTARRLPPPPQKGPPCSRRRPSAVKRSPFPGRRR